LPTRPKISAGTCSSSSRRGTRMPDMTRSPRVSLSASVAALKVRTNGGQPW
jgi:hypothetical protein